MITFTAFSVNLSKMALVTRLRRPLDDDDLRVDDDDDCPKPPPPTSVDMRVAGGVSRSLRWPESADILTGRQLADVGSAGTTEGGLVAPRDLQLAVLPASPAGDPRAGGLSSKVLSMAAGDWGT
jgi:hypothetical protein